MALKPEKSDEQHTKWVHVENGKVMVRRIHRMEVQARTGVMYTLHGKDLPDFVQTSAGEGYKGAHLAQILLKPEKISRRTPYTPAVANPFPSLRDVANMSMGVLGFLLLRFFIFVVTAGM
jgi:hypothetical protein